MKSADKGRKKLHTAGRPSRKSAKHTPARKRTVARRRPTGQPTAQSALKSLFDYAWDAMLVADRDRRIVDANPSTCELFGIPRDRLLRMRLDDLRRDFSKTRYKGLLDGTLRPPLVRGEHCVRMKDGDRKSLDVIGVRIDQNHAFFVIRDISERKNAEAKVRASEEKFRSIIRDAGPGIAYMDPAGVHVDVNDAFCRMTGFSREELLGRGMPYPYWPKDQIPRFTQGMRRALEGGYTVVETLFVRKDGRRFPVRIHPSFVRDHTGAKVGQIGFFEDISSWETLQQELIYAQKMQTVGALAGGIVHEFNNIHCGMRLVIETALAEMKHPLPIKKDLELVLERLERADVITGLLRTFAHRAPPRRTRTSLTEVVQEALGIAATALTRDGISVETSTAGEIPELVLNRVQMVQAILNLILNARDSLLSAETKRIRVETGAGETRAFVRVSDTGSGIPAEDIPSIFDPFFTTKEDRREQARAGFGLGLSVSEAIIRNHGGTIDVSSTVGGGSSFTVWLPLDPLGEPRISSLAELLTKAKGKRVFVAENDTVLRTLLVDALRGIGCVVGTSRSAEQSAGLLAEEEYDVAFIDLELPDEGAKWVLRKLARKKARPVTIFISGSVQAAGRRRSARRNADEMMYKPVTLDSLYAALDGALDAGEKKNDRTSAAGSVSGEGVDEPTARG